MTLTKLVSHHGDDVVYINLDQVVSVYVHEGNDYHVEMDDGSSFHIKLDDVAITGLIAAADAAYVAPA